ncbi:unnamed protein product [Acanthoscelides obtectus]|uniref:Uncharacterized protein n=1 Tax=Acanthoscelides obtectus TaxID=200917 RepID=A0A9P0Q0G9_ACAOB|nr:unnamed protein product [Acanthoscelides obtectus]CAK1637518.1 hypothetical protein AOBTE_LOCUS10017 [Acanthoscelides obtectus]
MIRGTIVIPSLAFLFLITAECLLSNEIGEGQMAGSGNRNCVCMNWRGCHGKINSDVQCPGSYINICCIVPTAPRSGGDPRYP